MPEPCNRRRLSVVWSGREGWMHTLVETLMGAEPSLPDQTKRG